MSMEVVHGHLNRSYTAPIPTSHSHQSHSHSRASNNQQTTNTVLPFQSHTNSFYSAFSRASSRMTDHSHDSLQPLLAQTTSAPNTNPQIYNGGPVVASQNVINRIADKEASLFQICISLRNRLEALPDFQAQLLAVESADEELLDPVTLLWRTFRRGYPLMTVYNAMHPPLPLSIDETRVPEQRRGKAAAFKFLHACVNQLHFPTEECFIISDLYGTDTSGFVKVARVVNRVVDILVQHGHLLPTDDEPTPGTDPARKRTQRQHIIDELVSTERTYVQHLEVLQAFKKLVEQKGFIPGDAIHDIFLNLNNLLDFQRRFLIRVEQTNAQPEEEQNWGRLFCSFAQGFDVYETYIANQKKCEETAMREFEKLRETGGPLELQQIVESPTHLTSFLLKPFQRLTRYPMLLKELRDKGDLDQARQDDISEGMEVPQAVLERTNEWIDREERQEAVQTLKSQVEDWKGHRVEVFGDLLLHGTFVVMKGDANKDNEREYRMYLFERILLCCKEANQNKQKTGKKQTPLPPDRKVKPKLVLSGRIFMQNVTETISVAKPGSYTCQVFWKGDDAIEFFVVKFTTEEIMRKWRNQIETQRRTCREHSMSMIQASGAENFYHGREVEGLETPFEENGEEEDYVATPFRHSGQLESGQNRHASNSSLRARALAGDVLPATAFNPARNPSLQNIGAQPLTLRTQQPKYADSSATEHDESFFSPALESPISQRTSASSGVGVYHLPIRQSYTPMSYRAGEESNRYTAPTLGRPRELSHGYQQAQRGVPASQYPNHHTAFYQTRVRSASSPDVQTMSNALQGAGMAAPPVPHVPAHLAKHYSASRRDSRSPIDAPLQHEGRYHGTEHDSYDGSVSAATMTLASPSRSAASAASMEGEAGPSAFKVKVKVPSEGSTMTLVVGHRISFAELKERIDAKLARHSSLSLGSGSVKLKYFYDDEFVSIQNDEDVQTAFEAWREGRQGQDPMMPGQLGEIEFYCHRPAG